MLWLNDNELRNLSAVRVCCVLCAVCMIPFLALSPCTHISICFNRAMEWKKTPLIYFAYSVECRNIYCNIMSNRFGFRIRNSIQICDCIFWFGLVLRDTCLGTLTTFCIIRLPFVCSFDAWNCMFVGWFGGRCYFWPLLFLCNSYWMRVCVCVSVWFLVILLFCFVIFVCVPFFSQQFFSIFFFRYIMLSLVKPNSIAVGLSNHDELLRCVYVLKMPFSHCIHMFSFQMNVPTRSFEIKMYTHLDGSGACVCVLHSCTAQWLFDSTMQTIAIHHSIWNLMTSFMHRDITLANRSHALRFLGQHFVDAS